MAFVPPIVDFGFKISGDDELRRRFAVADGRVRGMVHSALDFMARLVISGARSRAPYKTGNLRSHIGARFAFGRSGIRPEEGDRVVIRSDIGLKKFDKARPYAVEMGQLGRRKEVGAHNRRHRGRGWRTAAYKYTHTSVIGSTIRSRRFLGMRTIGGVPVKAYQRRFANKAHPFLGPAAEELRPTIEQALTVVLPRRLARLLATGEAT